MFCTSMFCLLVRDWFEMKCYATVGVSIMSVGFFFNSKINWRCPYQGLHQLPNLLLSETKKNLPHCREESSPPVQH